MPNRLNTPVPTQIIVFDIDGVLVEVSESYRESICRTVEHFTGTGVSRDLIQDLKNQGGYNDDWVLSHKLITDRGVTVPFEDVVTYFKKIFFGNGTDGLILREKWFARPGLLERLSDRFQLALFTGRTNEELPPTFRRFASHLTFDPIVTVESVKQPKPSPEGLLRIREMTPGKNILCYVGDSIDDARASRAADVPFIGIAAPSNPRHDELVALFESERALAILEDINQLEEVLP